MVAQVDERVGDEVDLVAVVAGVVAGGGVGAAREEEVRKAGGLDAEERLRAVGPVSGEGETVPSADTHARQAPVPKSKPVAHTMMSNSRRRRSSRSRVAVTRTIGVCLEVDEGDVGVVVGLVVAGHEGRPLLAETVVLGNQPLGGLGVLDDAADLLGDELAPLGVGRSSTVTSV